MPGMSNLWAYWAPPDERSRLIGMSHSGGQIGNILALLSGGYLCYFEFGHGWSFTFYHLRFFISAINSIFLIFLKRPSIFYLYGKCSQTLF